MQITNLKIKDILSIQDADISFEDTGLVLIEGWNHDADRANGAGKTAIFNCISFALFERLPRKITASEIVRRGCKTGSVTINFISNQDDWSVTRKRPKESKFFKNGIEQTISQEEFEEIIGLNYEQFMLTSYNAQNTSYESSRFLSCSDSDKKSFLLKLLNLEKFDIYKKISDTKTKHIHSIVADETSKLNSASSKIEAYTDSVIDEDEINCKINEIYAENNNLKSRIKQMDVATKPDLTKLNSIEDELKNKLINLVKSKTKREMLFDRYCELRDFKAEEACAACGSKLTKADAESHKNEINSQLIELKKQIDDLDLTVSKEAEFSNLLTKIKEKKKSDMLEYDSSQRSILEIKTIINSNDSKLDNLNLKLENNKKIVNKIKLLMDESIKLKASIDENKRQLEIYKTLSSAYSPTGAQAYVLDSIVDYFNENIQKYIDILWPNATYTLNSYKETAKGDVTAKFSEILSMDGQVVSIGSLSGGEFRALSLCIDFALLDVLSNQFSIRINPVMLDEPFDGLDTSGKEIVVGLLETISKERQILVVDHASESKTLFSKIIRVEKKSGISFITDGM
jgi:DNA repair exonuclease SbcCD ATPase subunit